MTCSIYLSKTKALWHEITVIHNFIWICKWTAFVFKINFSNVSVKNHITFRVLEHKCWIS